MAKNKSTTDVQKNFADKLNELKSHANAIVKRLKFELQNVKVLSNEAKELYDYANTKLYTNGKPAYKQLDDEMNALVQYMDFAFDLDDTITDIECIDD